MLIRRNEINPVISAFRSPFAVFQCSRAVATCSQLGERPPLFGFGSPGLYPIRSRFKSRRTQSHSSATGSCPSSSASGVLPARPVEATGDLMKALGAGVGEMEEIPPLARDFDLENAAADAGDGACGLTV